MNSASLKDGLIPQNEEEVAITKTNARDVVLSNNMASFAEPPENVEMEEPDAVNTSSIKSKSTNSNPTSRTIKFKGLYVVLFALASLNDGMIIGYKSSLVAIFTERNVPSEKRSLLTMISITYMLRMLVAPLADKYYFPSIGKRRTYIIPCKLFAFVTYFWASYYIEDWVNTDSVWTISGYFFIVNSVMMLENNALQGLRLDFFGRKEAGSAGAAHTISMFLGLAIGLQTFTALSSPYICKEYLGLPQPILNHSDLFQIISMLSLLGIGIISVIPEKKIDKRAESFAQRITPWRVLKALYYTPEIWSAMMWNFIGPNFVMGMKITAGQYYIKKGLKREAYILITAFVMIPITILSNFVWIRIIKRGKLMTKLWFAIMNGVVVEFLHVINYTYFDPAVNYQRTIICICCILCLDSLANWMMIQTSFFISTSSKKYSVTYISTIFSVFSACRVLPLSGFGAAVDYVSLQVLFGLCLAGQILYNAFTYNFVKKIDEADPKAMSKQFEEELEKEE